MTHNNPWAPGRYWQVFSTNPGHHTDGFPTTTAVCSHTNRRTAVICSWIRDTHTVLTNTRGISPRPSYTVRRTPNHAHRIDEETGTPCTALGDHYCPRLGTWTSHYDTDDSDPR